MAQGESERDGDSHVKQFVAWFRLPGCQWIAVFEGTEADCWHMLSQRAAAYPRADTMVLPKGRVPHK
jgi:hypothetical protein